MHANQTENVRDEEVSVRRELTYEGLRAELNKEIAEQERHIEEYGNYLEHQFASGRMSPGEPGDREAGRDLERAQEHLETLYGCSEDLAERQRSGVPLGSYRDDVFVEQLLDVLG